MKRTARLLSALLTLAIIFSTITGLSLTSASAASAPVYTVNAVTNLTYNNAQINAKITNPAKTKITKVGFQLGTKSGTWTYNKYDTVNMTNASVNASFLMSKYKVTLKASTKYYYRFYMTTGGKTSYSSVKNFTTLPSNPVFSVNKAADVTDNNAKISATITNPTKSKITKVGFQLGTKSGTWTYNKYDTVNMTNASVNASFLMSKYKVTLKANTKYFYRFYMTTGGKTYYSAVSDFKTVPIDTVYSQIKSIGISRIVQPASDKTGSCYISSIASLYAYKTGTYKTGGIDVPQSSDIYKKVLSKNKELNIKAKNGRPDTWVNYGTISAFGLKKQGYSLQNLYNSLKAGKPAVIYTGSHASIVIGYKGNNSTSLNASDFIVMEIKGGYYNTKKTVLYDKGYWDNSPAYFTSYANNPSKTYFGSKSCYFTLSVWSATNGTPKDIVTY